MTATRMTHVGPPRPLRWRIDVALGLGGDAIFDPGYRAFDDGDRSLLGLDLRLRADGRLGGGRLFLGGGLAYQRLGTDGSPYDGALDTELVVHEPLAFARLSVVAVEGIDFFGELAAGPTIAEIEIFGDPERAHQRAVTGTFTAQAGTLLYFPRPWLPRRGAARATAGLELALGYVLRGALDVEPTPQTEDDAIATESVGFGDVALRGIAWRLGVVVRFM